VPGLLARAALFTPVGTVLAEEVAFRSVLFAVAARAPDPRAARAAGAVVFGVWHLWAALQGRRPARGAAGAVVFTTAAGLLLDSLRRRSGSLLAPVGLHLGANSGGLVAVATAARGSSVGSWR
jgi:membrane protease YdiL (CAAX protease family)